MADSRSTIGDVALVLGRWMLESCEMVVLLAFDGRILDWRERDVIEKRPPALLDKSQKRCNFLYSQAKQKFQHRLWLRRCQCKSPPRLEATTTIVRAKRRRIRKLELRLSPTSFPSRASLAERLKLLPWKSGPLAAKVGPGFGPGKPDSARYQSARPVKGTPLVFLSERLCR